jgi:hypothetical protein
VSREPFGPYLGRTTEVERLRERGTSSVSSGLRRRKPGLQEGIHGGLTKVWSGRNFDPGCVTWCGSPKSGRAEFLNRDTGDRGRLRIRSEPSGSALVGGSKLVAARRQAPTLRAIVVVPGLEEGRRSRREDRILEPGCGAAAVRRAHDKPSAGRPEKAREFLLPAFCHAAGRFGSRGIERAGRHGVAPGTRSDERFGDSIFLPLYEARNPWNLTKIRPMAPRTSSHASLESEEWFAVGRRAVNRFRRLPGEARCVGMDSA